MKTKKEVFDSLMFLNAHFNLNIETEIIYAFNNFKLSEYCFTKNNIVVKIIINKYSNDNYNCAIKSSTENKYSIYHYDYSYPQCNCYYKTINGNRHGLEESIMVKPHETLEDTSFYWESIWLK